MMTANTPIIRVAGTQNEVSDLILDHASNQSVASGYTSGSAIVVPANAGGMSKSLFRNLSLGLRSYRLLDVPFVDGRTFWNNTFSHIYTRGCYGGAISILASGTDNWADNLYLQNSSFPVGFNHTATVNTNIFPVLVGTNLTFTLESKSGNWPYSSTNGSYVDVNYAPLGNASARFVTSVNFTGTAATNVNTITVALSPAEAAALGSPPLPLAGCRIYCGNAAESDGPMLRIGGGLKLTIGAIDAELTRFSPTLAMGGLIESSGELNIMSVHMEGISYTAAGQIAVRNFGGSMRIGEFNGVNISLQPGLTAYLFQNVATTFGGSTLYVGPQIIDVVRIRDFYAGGNLIVAAAPVGGAPKTHINWHIPTTSQRAGGRGDWPIGTATKYTPVDW